MRAGTMMLASALVLGFGAMGASPALAQDVAGQSAEQSATPPARAVDTSRRVCRNIRPTGSRLGTRQCRSQADWNRDAEETQDGLLRHQLENTIGTNPDTVRAGSEGRNI